jgi:hypothetical protein
MIERRDTEFYKRTWRWEGWGMIAKQIKQCDNTNQMAVIIGLMKTGCRCGELSSLFAKNVWVNEKKQAVVCSGMLVEKKKKREMLKDINDKPILIDGEKQFSIITVKEYRQFTFPLKERLSGLFLSYVDDQKDSEKPVFNYNRYQCYYHLSTIGFPEKKAKLEAEAEKRGENLVIHKKDWWKPEFRSPFFPHLYRHLRATQLCSEYSNFRNPMVLKDYFLWSDISMADYYIKLSLSDQYVNPKEIIELEKRD